MAISTLLLSTFALIPIKSEAALVTRGLVLNLDASVASSWNGTTWSDQSGAGRNATAVNAPTYNSVDKSFTLNGTNQYFNLGNVLNFTSNFTVEVTFSPNSVANSPALVARQNTSVAGNYFMGISNSKINYYVESSPWGLNSASTITTNTKYTATMVYDSSKVITPYLNGSVNGTPTSFSGGLGSSSINLQIGAALTLNAADNFFSGKIYSVRIWNRDLTATEVNENYRMNSDVVLGTTGASSGCNYPTSLPYGILFQAGTTSTINKIAVQVAGTTTTTQFQSNQFRIYADSSGTMSTLLGSFLPETMSASSTLSGATEATRLATYTGNVSLTAGTNFWIRTSAGGNSMYLCHSNGMTTRSSGWTPVMSGSSYRYFNGSYITYSRIFIIEVSITDENLNPTIGTPTLGGAAFKGQVVVISVVSDAEGKVAFYQGEKRIPGCSSRVTSGSSSSFTATCNWKPSVHGFQRITAKLTPAINGAASPTSTALNVYVNRRISAR